MSFVKARHGDVVLRRALPCAPVHLRRSSLRPQYELLCETHSLPFVVSVNDVPEARELYSRADSITSLRLGKNSSKPELLVVRLGNPVPTPGLSGAILCPHQD